MSWNSLAIMNFQGSDLPSASGPQRKKLKLLWVEIKLCPIEGFLKIVQIKVIKRCFHISERNLPKNDWLNSYKNEKPKSIKVKSFFFFFTLQYCIGFAIHQHASTTGIHVFPILNTPPTSLPIPSLWVITVHQPQASCILHRTWTGDLFLIWYYTCFNTILPNHPPPHRVQKTVLYFVTQLKSKK